MAHQNTAQQNGFLRVIPLHLLVVQLSFAVFMFLYLLRNPPQRSVQKERRHHVGVKAEEPQFGHNFTSLRRHRLLRPRELQLGFTEILARLLTTAGFRELVFDCLEVGDKFLSVVLRSVPWPPHSYQPRLTVCSNGRAYSR